MKKRLKLELLESIDADLRAKEVQAAQTAHRWLDKAKDMLKFRRPEGGKKAERGELLAEAQRAEWAGDFVHAAEIMETLGEMAQAGRLYEQAATRTIS